MDLGDVRADVAVKRLVGNLGVQCSEHESGCDWTGDLREFDTHSERCQYRSLKQSEMSNLFASADQLRVVCAH